MAWDNGLWYPFLGSQTSLWGRLTREGGLKARPPSWGRPDWLVFKVDQAPVWGRFTQGLKQGSFGSLFREGGLSL